LNPVHAILLHGLCSTPDELLSVETALTRAGHSVTALRIPGYSFEAQAPSQSRSQAHARGQPLTRYQDWLRTVQAVVTSPRAEARPVVLVGISAGATLALGALPLCGNGLAGLVLMSTTLRYGGWAVPWYQFLMPLALYTPLGRYWQYREHPPYGVKNPRVRRWIERELQTRRVSSAGAAVIGVAHLREHDRLRRHVLASLPGLSCPRVLALHALEDEVASPSNLSLLDTMQAASMRQVLLRDSYHMISIDNDREQVVRETLDFVRTISDDGLTGASVQGASTRE
jgi:carboxylesterase